MPETSQPLIWHSLEIFCALCRRMEHRRAVALGGKLGSLVARFSRKKVSEAVARCMKILGVPRGRAEEIVRGAYEHFGRAAAEFARMPIMADRIDELVTSEGHEYLFDAVKSGRGAILATAHIGNWEYSACWLAHHGLPINSLGADQRDERITELNRPGREGGGRRLALPRLSREHAARPREARGEARLRRDSGHMRAQSRRRHLLDEILPADEGPQRRALRKKHTDEHRRPQRRHIRGHKGTPGAVDVDVPALGVGRARNLRCSRELTPDAGKRASR